MVANGRNLKGWTHHAPDLANSTTRWPGRAPWIRPATGAIRSGPPGAASGTSVNSIAGASSAGLRTQPATARQTISAAHERDAAMTRLMARLRAMAENTAFIVRVMEFGAVWADAAAHPHKEFCSDQHAQRRSHEIEPQAVPIATANG